jgi:hypothetical protein
VSGGLAAQGRADPRVPSRLSVARWRCQFWADCATNISERRFSTGTGGLMLLIIQLKFFGCNIP